MIVFSDLLLLLWLCQCFILEPSQLATLLFSPSVCLLSIY